jgi:hypothetical protein
MGFYSPTDEHSVMVNLIQHLICSDMVDMIKTFPFHDTQTPGDGQVFFDHVAWLVNDMDAASAVFERLGFILTPYSIHGNRDPETGDRIPQGTANRLTMLRTGYIELLCEAGDVEAPVVEDLRARLARYEGVQLLVFTEADAEAAYTRISENGIPVQPMVHLRRDVEAADGSDTEVQFSVIRAAFDAIPEGRIQLITHHTPEHMWQDRYISYANGIFGLLGATLCVEDPSASVQNFEKVAGRDGTVIDADEVHLICDRGGMRLVTPKRLAEIAPNVDVPSLPYTAFIEFVADDLDVSRKYFASVGIATTENDGVLLVDPKDSLGTGLMIRQAV